MSGIATAIVGSAIVGGVLSSKAAGKAADATTQATEATVAEQRRQYDQTRTDQMPWMDAGKGALNRLQDPTANFSASPGYQFRLSEGQRGVQQSAAARGGAYSGNAMKALNDYNQGMASSEYSNWWNQQAGLAGVGQSSANAVGQFGANASSNIGNALMAGGDARASGIMGSANSLTGALNSGLNSYMLYKGGYFTKPTAGIG